MTSNYLKLNDNKTEVIIVGTRAQLWKSNINTIDVCNSKIAHKNSVKDIGVYIDSELIMKHHVMILHHIRLFLSFDVSTIHYFVVSHTTMLPSSRLSKMFCKG